MKSVPITTAGDDDAALLFPRHTRYSTAARRWGARPAAMEMVSSPMMNRRMQVLLVIIFAACLSGLAMFPMTSLYGQWRACSGEQTGGLHPLHGPDTSSQSALAGQTDIGVGVAGELQRHSLPEQVPSAAPRATVAPSQPKAADLKPVRTDRLSQVEVAATPPPEADCDINPPLFFEKSMKMKPECAPRQNVADDPMQGWPLEAYVLSLDRDGAAERYEVRRSFLKQHGIELRRMMAVDGAAVFGMHYSTDEKGKSVYVDPKTKQRFVEGRPGYLSPGERGYQATMYKLFSELSEPGRIASGNILVVDDDVVFECDFKEKLTRLLSEQRCSTMVLANSNPAGILMLGSAVWVNGTYPQKGWSISGWFLSDAEIEILNREAVRSTPFGETPNLPQCINAHARTYGSFAMLYHTSIFQTVMKWIEGPGANIQFDTMYPYLWQHGFMVRVAHPPIAIQDVRHASQVKDRGEKQMDMARRVQIHRWGDISRFCDPLDGSRLSL
ncbi:hypothetical protein FVE85_2301 [Porphyridium purpureum]|uniref:Uncharacterized protein n=1 Tax=Porphyridium purpureum TaxID=35688 RepID=A0A5J4YXR5_PORPP|nr:hypothetical protein FVE85_2301 [Porphyridium purpureum]|eukprot:POR5951..scf209_3